VKVVLIHTPLDRREEDHYLEMLPKNRHELTLLADQDRGFSNLGKPTK
jgi:hypothetical protein